MKLPAPSAVAGPSRYGMQTQRVIPPGRRAIRSQSTWASVVDSAKTLVSNGTLPPPAGKKQQQNFTPASINLDGKKFSAIGNSSMTPPAPIIRDPLELVGNELSSLRANVSTLLGSGHPSLDSIAKYYFQAEGKHVRPLIVLLMAKATNGISPVWPKLISQASKQRERMNDETSEVEIQMGMDEPLSPREVLNDFNPHMESVEGRSSELLKSAFTEHNTASSSITNGVSILPTQRRLAEITEMIHVASLLHDDVIDESSLRRGAPSAPAAFGNKLSILGGDFLLGRASVALARLRNNEVVELLATVIANLVEGEVMQLRSQAHKSASANAPRKSVFSSFWSAEDPTVEEVTSDSEGPTLDVFEHYLQKTYLKTAALIGKSARAATILGGCGAHAIQKGQFGTEAEKTSQIVRDAAYTFGRNLGIAFQLVDDFLDFQSTSDAFGKPSDGADLRLGLATAPVLYAWQEFPKEGLGEMIKRKFEGKDDVEKALAIVRRSKGLERTKDLAQHHANLAQEALLKLPESEARHALSSLNQQIITRVK